MLKLALEKFDLRICFVDLLQCNNYFDILRATFKVHPMHTHKIVSLVEADRPLILAHHLALDSSSRYSRFHTGANDIYVGRYVSTLDLKTSQAFGVIASDGSDLAGFIHMAPLDPSRVEIGVSVLIPYRRQRIARALVEHCEKVAFQRAYDYLEMYCLMDNQGLRAIARGLGMSLTMSDGEAHAIATLRRPVTGTSRHPSLETFWKDSVVSRVG
jgi:ribosomal protein S18 acetylase RimI-like enzyme